MMPQKRVAVLVGSLRKGSFTRMVANSLIEVAPVELKLEIKQIGNLPLYNQDSDEGNPPAAWVSFRQEIRAGRLKEAASHISDHTLNTLMAVGTPSDLIEGIERMKDAGLESLTFSGVMGPDPEAAIHLLGKEILPRFR